MEDLRDAYTGSLEETILTGVVANVLDSGATRVRLLTDAVNATLTVIDDGRGMQRRELARYHDVAASTKPRGDGIGFAGVGIKLGLLVSLRGHYRNEARRDVCGLWPRRDNTLVAQRGQRTKERHLRCSISAIDLSPRTGPLNRA